MKRTIINIDNNKCNGCGVCVPGCPEGAIQIIDGKARLVSDLFCDGLGACIKECPQGAINIEEREAQPYNERMVMDNIVKQGDNTIKAHLKHLKDHGEVNYFAQAIDVLKEKNIPVPDLEGKQAYHGCPGSRQIDRRSEAPLAANTGAPAQSELRQWPVQLKLINPHAPFLREANLVIAADCAPFAYGDFHRKFLRDKALIIMCPKLDPYGDEYVEKLTAIIANADLKSLSIVRMEVPCCGGINVYVQRALEKAGKSMIVKEYIVSINGEIL